MSLEEIISELHDLLLEMPSGQESFKILYKDKKEAVYIIMRNYTFLEKNERL